jgi:hypothetical protein
VARGNLGLQILQQQTGHLSSDGELLINFPWIAVDHLGSPWIALDF